jgi:hypothetical protein
VGETNANEAAAATRRELIAFAFVEESYLKSGDIVGGLLPLFAPVLAKRAHRIFDSAQFAADVQATYDIPMSPLVADGLVERLAEAGLLRMDGSDQHTYRIAAQPNLPTIDEAGVDAFLTDFSAFARSALDRVKLTATDDVLQSGLLKRLTTAYFLSFVDKREKNYTRGRTVFDGPLDGPFLMIDLPRGRYTVEATWGDQTVRRTLSIGRDDHDRMVLYFNVPGADVLQAPTG